MAYTRRQGTTNRTATNKVVAIAAVDESLDEAEQGQEELEEDDTDNEDEDDEDKEDEAEEEEVGSEKPDEPTVVAATIPVTAPAPVAPPDGLEVPTGTPAEQIRQCYFELGKLLQQVTSNPEYKKRITALLNGKVEPDNEGKRPGDRWQEQVQHWQDCKSAALALLEEQAMKQQ